MFSSDIYYIVELSSNNRYSLTLDGESLAVRIESAENGLSQDPLASSPVLPTISLDRVSSRQSANVPNTHSLSGSSDDEPCIIEESFRKGRDIGEDTQISPFPSPSPPVLDKEADGENAVVSGLNLCAG